jgi:hypothetical protein
MWQVEIVHGAEDIDPSSAPVMFGTRQVTVQADGGLSEPREPLVYAPVELFSIDDSLVIRTLEWRPGEEGDGRMNGHPTDHREMVHVHRFEFDWNGDMLVSGLEARKDGAVVMAYWRVSPFTPPDPECACGHPVQWHQLEGGPACTSTWPEDCACPAFRREAASGHP